MSFDDFPDDYTQTVTQLLLLNNNNKVNLYTAPKNKKSLSAAT